MSGYVTPAEGGGGVGGGIPDAPGGGIGHVRTAGSWLNADTRYAGLTHTHVPADVVGFSEAVDDRVAALLLASGAITLTYDDPANTLTIGAPGGGGIAEAPNDGTAYVRRNLGWTSGDARYAAASHTHASTAITDFVEAVQDTVAAFLVNGTNITLVYDDVANTLTVNAAGGGGIAEAPNDGTAYVRRNLGWTNGDTRFAAASHTHAASAITDFAEAVDDRVAALLVAAGVVSITYDDAGNTLTISATGGGGGSPGGSVTQFQFHDTGGVLAGTANLVRRADDVVALPSFLEQDAIAPPAAPVAGRIRHWARSLAGRTVPHVTVPGGVRYALQSALWGRYTAQWNPLNAGTIQVRNMQIAAVTGTATHPALALTNIFTAAHRTQIVSNAAASSNCGVRASVNLLRRGAGANGGGFFAFFTFGVHAMNTDGQFCVGLSSITTALGGEPSTTQNNIFAVAKDSGDAQLQFMRRTGTGTTVKVPLGVTPAAQQMFEMAIFCAPGSSEMSVLVTQLDWAGDTVLLDATYSTDLPDPAAFLGPRFEARTTTLTTSVGVAMMNFWAEADQ